MGLTYEVEAKYMLDDRASAKLAGIATNADRASASLSALEGGMKALGGVLLGGAALEKGKHFFIDLNSEMEQLKISMASVMSYNLGNSFADASAKSEKLIAGWQEFSKTTTLTTQQFTEFGSALTGAVSNAGGGLGDLDQLVKKGAVVGQLLSAGHAGGLKYVQLELREALMGNVRRTQMFNQQLLGPTMKKLGKDVEDFNKMSSMERLHIIQQALSDPAWEGAIAKMKNSWLGVTSTLQDNLEIAGREIGLPLFKAMSAEVGKWNEWIKQHPEELKEFSKAFSDNLITGFKMVRDVMSFIVDHKNTLMALAGVWGMSKLTGAGASGFVGGIAAARGIGPGVEATAAATMGRQRDFLGQAMHPDAWMRGAMSQGLYIPPPSQSLMQRMRGGLGAAGSAVGGALKGASPMAALSGGMMGYGLSQFLGETQAFSSEAKSMTTTMMTIEGAMSSIPGPVGQVTGGLLLLHAGLLKFVDWIDEKTKDFFDKQSMNDRVVDMINKVGTKLPDANTMASLTVNGVVNAGPKGERDQILGEVVMVVRELGAFNQDATLNQEKLTAAMDRIGMNKEGRDRFQTYAEKAFDTLGKGEGLISRKMFRLLGISTEGDPITGGAKGDKAPTNININRIEVASDDPDRFAVDMVSSLRRMSRNPTQAAGALPGMG